MSGSNIPLYSNTLLLYHHYITPMEGVDKFLKDYFSAQVEEDSKGIKVVFVSKKDLVSPSIIWFTRAKRGWSRKPIVQNNYIIVDADTEGVLTFVNKYYGITEEDLPKVRMAIVNMAMEVIDNYFSPPDSDEGNKDTQ